MKKKLNDAFEELRVLNNIIYEKGTRMYTCKFCKLRYVLAEFEECECGDLGCYNCIESIHDANLCPKCL